MTRRGPRTPDGLAISSRNAERHGLYSEALVIAGETLEDWQQFHDGVVESLAPEGTLEAEFAGRAASLLWRLRRVSAAEANLVARDHLREAENAERRTRIRMDGKDPANAGVYYASALPAPVQPEPPLLPIPEVRFLDIIARYEAHLNRQLLHTMHELEALQGRRQGHRVPLARVDVQGLPGT